METDLIILKKIYSYYVQIVMLKQTIFVGKIKTKKAISDEDLIFALRNNPNIHQALLTLGRVDGRLYERAYYLIDKESIIFPEKEREEKKCKKCGKIISKRAMLCEECYHLLSRKNDRPSKE